MKRFRIQPITWGYLSGAVSVIALRHVHEGDNLYALLLAGLAMALFITGEHDSQDHVAEIMDELHEPDPDQYKAQCSCPYDSTSHAHDSGCPFYTICGSEPPCGGCDWCIGLQEQYARDTK